MKREPFVGASDTEIEQFLVSHGCRQVSSSVREIFRLLGRRSGVWFDGTDFGTDVIDSETKSHALAALVELDHEICDLDGMLVLSAHQGYAFHVIDGQDLQLDDPPVWDVVDGDYAAKVWPSTSDWFIAMAPDVEEIRERADRMRAKGRVSPWEEDLEPW
ncbi:hypothetical protein [Nocardia sp. NPDC048505]|uniref:hypothetical protein n=1 Tax=unclassified Nocardia TaxID=2637762 RepID=UPI0034047243